MIIDTPFACPHSVIIVARKVLVCIGGIVHGLYSIASNTIEQIRYLIEHPPFLGKIVNLRIP